MNWPAFILGFVLISICIALIMVFVLGQEEDEESPTRPMREEEQCQRMELEEPAGGEFDQYLWEARKR